MLSCQLIRSGQSAIPAERASEDVEVGDPRSADLVAEHGLEGAVHQLIAPGYREVGHAVGQGRCGKRRNGLAWFEKASAIPCGIPVHGFRVVSSRAG